MNFNEQKTKGILNSFVGGIEDGVINIDIVNLDNETNVKRIEIVYTENKEESDNE